MNLIGKVDEYEAQKTQSGLTPGLKKILHSIDWPINLNTPNIHIASFFGKHYFVKEKGFEYDAIDIQVPKRTEVFAPEDAKFVDARRYDEEFGELGYIQMWGLESRMLYTFGNIQYGTMPYDFKIAKPLHSQNYKRMVIKKGSPLGNVGLWPGKLDRRADIPADVEEVYGRSYDHLSIEMENCRSGLRAFPFHNDLQVRMVNPLQFLKELE